MQTTSTDVRAFHNKHGFPCDMNLRQAPVREDTVKLLDIAETLAKLAEQIKPIALASQKQGDERLYRTHLIVEEVAEAVQAMGQGDEVELADATADLRYVTLGTDVTFGIPSEAVDHEVHKSNMSKAVRDKTKDPRMKNKGPNYKPPDIAAALESGRRMSKWNAALRRNHNEALGQTEGSQVHIQQQA